MSRFSSWAGELGSREVETAYDTNMSTLSFYCFLLSFLSLAISLLRVFYALLAPTHRYISFLVQRLGYTPLIWSSVRVGV